MSFFRYGNPDCLCDIDCNAELFEPGLRLRQTDVAGSSSVMQL